MRFQKNSKRNEIKDKDIDKMLLTGSEVIIECLKEQGVDTVFGYPGVAICPFYDSILDISKLCDWNSRGTLRGGRKKRQFYFI